MSNEQELYVAHLGSEVFYDMADNQRHVLEYGVSLLLGDVDKDFLDDIIDHLEELVEDEVPFVVDMSEGNIMSNAAFIKVDLPEHGGYASKVVALPLSMVCVDSKVHTPNVTATAAPKIKASTAAKIGIASAQPNKASYLKPFSPFRKEEPNMKTPVINLDGFTNVIKTQVSKMFTETSDVLMDLQTGLLGIIGPDGSVITAKAVDGKLVASANPMSFLATPVPAFAMRKPVSSIKVGDVILLDTREPAFVSDVSDGKIEVLKGNETAGTIVPIANTMFGSGVLVVQSLFQGGSVNPMLAMMLMSQGGSELKDLLPMFLMSQAGGQGGDFSKVLPLLMLTGSSGSGDMMQMMMMAQMFGGAEGKSPFGDIFAGLTGAFGPQA